MNLESDEPQEIGSRVCDRLTRLACARAILRWHQDLGAALAVERLPLSIRNAYMAQVRQYSSQDLANPQVQDKIAREQMSGAFEWAFSEQLPLELWSNLCREWHGEVRMPERLCEAARLILQMADCDAPSERAQRTTVHVASRQELDGLTRAFYVEFTSEEHLGIGGVNVLLACSLERSDMHTGGRNSHAVTLLGADVLGMHRVGPGERPDGLIDALRSGRLRVEEVVGK